MGWLSPWLLLGLAGLALPVLAHLARRDEALTRRFPSLMFVQRMPYPLRRRKTLRDRPLLALRCLALAVLVLGFAGPYCSRDGVPAVGNDALPDVVLLLDVSYSMSQPARWAAALAAARERLAGLTGAQRAALILFDDGATVAWGLSPDRAGLRGRLDGMTAGQGGTRFQAGFDAAARLLADSGSSRATVVLISDLQATGLTDSQRWVLPSWAGLAVEKISTPVGANGALMDAGLAPGEDPAAVRRTLAVRVRNTGDAPLEDAGLSLSVAGERTYQAALSLRPGEERRLSLPLTLARHRPVPVRLDLSPDAIEADNRHHLVLGAGRALRVVLVASHRRRNSVYLEQALALAPAAVVSRRLKAAQLSSDNLKGADIVIVDDAPLPQGRAFTALKRFVAGGGGLLVIAGPDTTGPWPQGAEGFLPGRLGAADSGSLHLDTTRGAHPLAAAAGLTDGAFAGVRVRLYRSWEGDEQTQVVLRLDNGAPLLVQRDHGSGRVLALTTTADPRWNNLVFEPGFVPLVHAMLDVLAQRHPPRPAVTLGETVDLRRYSAGLPGAPGWRAHLDGGGAVFVESPHGPRQRLAAGQPLFTPDRVGRYELHRGGGDPLPLAVNGPRRESLLDAVDAAVIENRLMQSSPERDAAVLREVTTVRDRWDWGPYLLLLGGLLLVAEGRWADRLSARRRGSSSS